MSDHGIRLLDEALAHAEQGEIAVAWSMLNAATGLVPDRVHRAANLMIFNLAALTTTDVREEVIYVLRSGEFVKIGRSVNPKARIASYGTHSPDPMELLLCIPSSRATERELHERFAAFREKGEWFRLQGDLQDWVAAERTRVAA